MSHISRELIGRIYQFENAFHSFSMRLADYKGMTLKWEDLYWIYIESVAREHALTRGLEMGGIFFVDEIRHSKIHYLWFGLVAAGKSSFDCMCELLSNLASQDPGYIFEYYRAIHRNKEEARPELRAQFDSSFPVVDDDSNVIKNTTNLVQSGSVVYFWSPPESAFSEL